MGPRTGRWSPHSLCWFPIHHPTETRNSCKGRLPYPPPARSNLHGLVLTGSVGNPGGTWGRGGANWGKGRSAKWPPWLEGDAPPIPRLRPGQLLSRSQGLKPEPLVGEGRQLWPRLGAGPGQAEAPSCKGPRNLGPSGQDAPTATGAFGESYSPTRHATQTPRGSRRGPDPAWCLGSPIASGGEAPPHAPQSRGLIFSQE